MDRKDLRRPPGHYGEEEQHPKDAELRAALEAARQAVRDRKKASKITPEPKPVAVEPQPVVVEPEPVVVAPEPVTEPASAAATSEVQVEVVPPVVEINAIATEPAPTPEPVVVAPEPAIEPAGPAPPQGVEVAPGITVGGAAAEEELRRRAEAAVERPAAPAPEGAPPERPSGRRRRAEAPRPESVDVEAKIRELREKVRFIGYEVDPAKMLDRGKLKETFGEVLRETVAALMEEQDGVFTLNAKDRAREQQAIEKIRASIGRTYGLDEKQCADIFYALKAQLIEGSKSVEVKGLWRMFRPKTKGGIAAKVAGYVGAGFAGFATLGLGGIVATGALRQIDILGNTALDRKLLNQFRQGKKTDQAFLSGLEDRLTALVVETKRSSLEKQQGLHPETFNLEGRTRHYFDRIDDYLKRENPQMQESDRHAIAQRLAVHYALDDEAGARERELEARRADSFSQNVWGSLKRLDGRVAGNTLNDRLYTGAAATGIGLGLALAARSSTWGRRLVAGYGGWKLGGAFAEWRGRKELSPILSTQKSLDDAAALLSRAREAGVAGQLNVRTVMVHDLERTIAEVKARLEQFPQDTAPAKFVEFKNRLRELQLELIMLRFEDGQRAGDRERAGTIQDKLAVAHLRAQGIRLTDEAGRAAVAAQRRKLAASGLLWRMLGAAGGVLLSEGIVKALEHYRNSQVAEEAKRIAAETKPEAAKAAVAPVVPEAPKPPTAQELLDQFRTENKLLAKLEHDKMLTLKYNPADGSIHLTTTVGAKGKFDHLQQLLRRIMIQEHQDGTTFTKFDRAEIENAVANDMVMLRDDQDVSQFKHTELDTLVQGYNPKARMSTIDIIYRGSGDNPDFEAHAAKVLGHADEIAPRMVEARGAGLATVDNNSTELLQQLQDWKHSSSVHSPTVLEVAHDPDVIAANNHVMIEHVTDSDKLGFPLAEVHATGENSGNIEIGDYTIAIKDGRVLSMVNAQTHEIVDLRAQHLALTDYQKTHAALVKAMGEYTAAREPTVLFQNNVDALQDRLPGGYRAEMHDVTAIGQGVVDIKNSSGQVIHRIEFVGVIGVKIDEHSLTNAEQPLLYNPEEIVAAAKKVRDVGDLFLAPPFGRANATGQLEIGGKPYDQKFIVGLNDQPLEQWADTHRYGGWRALVGAAPTPEQTLADILDRLPSKPGVDTVGQALVANADQLARLGSPIPLPERVATSLAPTGMGF